jgi:hypothetical protein
VSAQTRMTKEEWLAEGARRFGPDWGEWKFVCPICNNVAAIKDFEPYKDQGSSPNSATCECIGRYAGGVSAFGNIRKNRELVAGVALTSEKKPCDYAGYGLFRLSPVMVIDGDREIHSFAFAEKS